MPGDLEAATGRRDEEAGGQAMTHAVRLFIVVSFALLTPATVVGAAGGAEEGRRLFFSQGCYGCHRIGAAGTPIAYDLSHIGRKYKESELARWLRDPAAQRPSHMPRLALTEDEILALAAYLASLQ
jgi:mono/diheme cytochrome c family protein